MINMYMHKIAEWEARPIIMLQLASRCLSGFHLDIDSRDGKMLVLRNKGW